MQYVCAISKAMKWPPLLPRQTIQHHSNPSLCPNYWCWRNWSWLVLWKLTASSRTNTEKDVLSIIGDWNARKSRDTWSNRQVWLWSTERSRPNTNTVLPRERTGHNKHPLATTQETTLHIYITRWSIPKSDWLYSLQPKTEKLYTVNTNRTRSWLWLRSWTSYCQIRT